MFRLLKWVFGGISHNENSDLDALHEKIRRLEEALTQSNEAKPTLPGKSEQQRGQDVIEPTDCFQKTGRITAIKSDHFIIDNMYFVPKMLLKNCGECVEENTRLLFLAHRKHDATSGESTIKVVKILSVVDELWTESGLAATDSNWNEKTTKPPTEKGTVYYKETQRREPGKVISKDGNTIIVETDAGDPLEVDMDKTRMSFVPARGDYVTLDCLVQIDQEYVDFKGEVLEVVAIEPSRTVNGSGKISAIEPNGGEIFTLNGKYVYQSECLVDSYRPAVGDTVTFSAIENEHVQMRCLSVKFVIGSGNGPAAVTAVSPATANGRLTHSNGTTVKNGGKTKNDPKWLYEDKEGIKIVGDLRVCLKHGTDETVVRTITVKNESTQRRKILLAKPAKYNKTPLITLQSPMASAQKILFPGESVDYVFHVTGNIFSGNHWEQWIWKFEGNFDIARTFNVVIGDQPVEGDNGDEATSSPPNGYATKTKYLQQKLASLNMRREHKTARVIPGQKISKTPNFIAYSIPSYVVPPDLFDLILTTEDKDVLRDALDSPPYCLFESLSAKNYARLFGTCIYLEEIHVHIAFRKYDMERAHFTREDTFLVLNVQNIAEARPSVMVGDMVNASAPWTREDGKEVPIYQGIVHKVLQNRLLLKFDQNFHTRYNGESYALTFQYGRGVFRKQHHAITKVKTTMGLEYLFPESIVPRKPSLNVQLNNRFELVLENESGTERTVLPWQNPNLNRYQKVAIKNVLRSEASPMPYIIFGPPGTGKTVTTIELIHQLALNSPDCRLIVATPSNSSAYLITERLANAGVLKAGDFIRLVSMNQVERESIPEHLAPYCATVDISEERSIVNEMLVTSSGLRLKMQAKHIGRHRVTISTCSGIGLLMYLRFPRNHFTHVIVDESGQAHEPETLIPMSLINRTVGSVVLVGDPKQLGPTVLSLHAQHAGYEVSLLERLLNTARPYSIDQNRFPDTHGYDPRLVTKLCINYRSIPSVLALYSDLFYDSQLEPDIETPTSDDFAVLQTMHDILGVQRSTADYGFFFCGIDGTNKQAPDSPSWFNPAEACMVHKVVEKLYRKGYKPHEIGIITPYVMQVKTIRRIFDVASLEPPKVGSVEEFQGQERRIMILSTVRSSAALLAHDHQSVLGFVSAPKRVNVSISRAKVALVVVGNPKLLSVDRIWLQVLQRAVSNETYVGLSLPSSILAAIKAGTPLPR